jgi:hypothetical protein
MSASILVRRAPPPALRVDGQVAASYTVLFGLRIDSAVNLLEAREYAELDRVQRLHKALEEQRGFINQVRDPSLGAIDLRTLITPGAPVPIQVALMGRLCGPDRASLEEQAAVRQQQLLASLPRHVNATPISDRDELAGWLAPLGTGAPDAAMITRRELVAVPRRPDASVAYYFSVVPFNWADTDWTNLYSTLAASPVRLVLSVALLPVEMPDEYKLLLEHFATFYGRLAKEDRLQGGLYHGERMIPPDAFAVDAQPVFEDYARRYSGRVFAIRIQVASDGPLPAGVAQAIGAAVSPGDDPAPSHLDARRAASSFEVRHADSDYERQLARWNLDALDFAMFDGDPAIWARSDPPSSALATLCVLGDARDASCAFRFPVAIDGTVPGFSVRRGEFGHEEAYAPSGPALVLGRLPGRDDVLAISLNNLTKHALIAGSTGSGKTTTVLELVRQLWLEHGVPFLVIEPVNSDANDYRRLLAEPGFEALQIYTVGDESRCPLRFNPFEAPTGVQVAEHAANLLACFKAAFGLWEPLPGIYQEALNLTYLDAGILASERPDGQPRTWPTAVEFMHAMRRVTANLGYAGEVKHNIEAASIRRAEQLAAGVSSSAFLTSQPNDIGSLLDHPVIIELKSLGSGDEQALMIALLLNALTEHYQAVRGASSKLEHVTVIEEAHRLLQRPEGGGRQEEAQAKEKAAEAFANTLAENRKYGEGIVIAEQLPTKLVVDAVKNTNLKVMHRLTSEEDRRYLGETMGLDEPQMRFATRLVTGEALVYGDEFPEARQVAVKPALSSRQLSPPDPSIEPPFTACAACRAQCAYRGAALAMVRDGSLVEGMQKRVRYLERRDTTAEDRGKAWEGLLDSLRSSVARFPALPNEDPGLSDAAYCLFLHSLAVRRMHFAPTWPKAVAKRLGIEEPVAAGTGTRGG